MSRPVSRPVYVYRLIIRHQPDRPTPMIDSPVVLDEEGWWHWPQVRQYLTKGGADRRADLLRNLGCTVEVQRSKRVEWPPFSMEEL